MREQVEGLLDRLQENELRTIAIMKLQGATNHEIAQQLDCTERTIERKLNRIRELWGSLLPEADQ